MNSAKFGFLLIAGFRSFAAVIGAGALGIGGALTPYAAGIIAGGLLLDIGVPLLAAWRLHVGAGAFATPIVTILYVLGILAGFTSGVPMAIIGGLVVGAIFTGVFVSGARGAWALRRGTGFDDDVIDTFT